MKQLFKKTKTTWNGNQNGNDFLLHDPMMVPPLTVKRMDHLVQSNQFICCNLHINESTIKFCMSTYTHSYTVHIFPIFQWLSLNQPFQDQIVIINWGQYFEEFPNSCICGTYIILKIFFKRGAQTFQYSGATWFIHPSFSPLRFQNQSWLILNTLWHNLPNQILF